MISGQVNESPGPLAHRSRACVEGDSGAAGGQSRANSGRTLPSKSHGPSAKQPGVTRPLTTPALVRPRKPCSVPWLPPREPHSLPAEHGLPFHFLKTSSAPLSRPPVDGRHMAWTSLSPGHPAAWWKSSPEKQGQMHRQGCPRGQAATPASLQNGPRGQQGSPPTGH